MAIARVEGAAKAKFLDVDVGSRVLASALQDVSDNWTKAAVKAAGGEEAIRDKFVGMLNLAPDVTPEKLARAL